MTGAFDTPLLRRGTQAPTKVGHWVSRHDGEVTGRIEVTGFMNWAVEEVRSDKKVVTLYALKF